MIMYKSGMSAIRVAFKKMAVSSLSISTLLLASTAATLVPIEKAFAIGELTCVADSTVNFNPGLRIQEQSITTTFNVNYSSCTSLTGSIITSGNRNGSFIGTRSCLLLPPAGTAEFTVQWSNGQSSVINGTSQSVEVAGQTVHLLNGPVIAGEFFGKTYSEQVVQTALDLNDPLVLLDCLFPPGILSQTGVGLMEIN
jgi:hypothetical protein